MVRRMVARSRRVRRTKASFGQERPCSSYPARRSSELQRRLSHRNRGSSPSPFATDSVARKMRSQIVEGRICSHCEEKTGRGHREMMSRLAKTITVMALTTPLIAASLGGCIWHTKETKEVERDRGGDKK